MSWRFLCLWKVPLCPSRELTYAGYSQQDLSMIWLWKFTATCLSELREQITHSAFAILVQRMRLHSCASVCWLNSAMSQWSIKTVIKTETDESRRPEWQDVFHLFFDDPASSTLLQQPWLAKPAPKNNFSMDRIQRCLYCLCCRNGELICHSFRLRSHMMSSKWKIWRAHDDKLSSPRMHLLNSLCSAP